MTELTRPPANIAPYVEVLGVDDAIAVLTRLGGAEAYLAENPKGRSAVTQLVGVQKAAALAQALGAGIVRIPLGKPWVARVWHARGLPVAEIARRLHVSDVTVRRYISGAAPPAPDPRQPRLL